MEHDRHFASVNFLEGCDDGCTGLAVGVGIGLVGLSETHQHGFAAFGAHEGHRCVGLGFEVSIGQHTVDLALERGWDSLDDFREGFFALEER